MLDIRHERCSKCLEKGGNHGVQAGEVCAKTSAERKQASEEGDDGEEQRDQVEGEHEAAEVVVLVSANELLRDIVVGAEVPRRIKRQSWDGAATVHAVAVVCAANREEGPSRRVADHLTAAGDAIGACLEEVDISQRHAGVCRDAGEDDEELKDNTAGEDDEGDDAQEWSCIRQSEAGVAMMGH